MTFEKCERCKHIFREDDLTVDEDTHELLCPDCYHGDEEE